MVSVTLYQQRVYLMHVDVYVFPDQNKKKGQTAQKMKLQREGNLVAAFSVFHDSKCVGISSKIYFEGDLMVQYYI